MLLFSSKIDPFSSYTINLGPLYVERVFDSLLMKESMQGIGKMTAKERFVHYLEWLRQRMAKGNRQQYAVIQFYKGHFYQQLAMLHRQSGYAQHLMEKALCAYQDYLELPHSGDESRYYAQWQAGMLQFTLDYPWPLVEDTLLKATGIDPLRGEAIKKITEYYTQRKEWEMAYSYSLMAVNRFLNKNPIAQRRWHIDFSAYDQNIIDGHLRICAGLSRSFKKNLDYGNTIHQAIS